MRKPQSTVCLKTIENTQKIKINDSEISIVQDKIYYRKKRINELRLRGYTNQQISQKTGFNLSTIEKDLHIIRENSRQWFESESITEYCQSIQDTVILYNCGIEELQLLYEEENEVEIKVRIWSKILEFSEQKIKLLKKTKSVKNYYNFDCKLSDKNLEGNSI